MISCAGNAPFGPLLADLTDADYELGLGAS